MAIRCQFASQSSDVVLPYFAMNQSNMCRNTVFRLFMRIGSYVSRITFGRFKRKMLVRAEFIVMMSALESVAFRLSRSLSEVHVKRTCKDAANNKIKNCVSIL